MYDGLEEVRKGLYVNSKGNIVRPILKDIHGKVCLGNIHWKNLFIGGSWTTLIIIVCLLFAAYGYQTDTAECFELLEDPCVYADSVGCWEDYIPGESKFRSLGGLNPDYIINFSLDT